MVRKKRIIDENEKMVVYQNGRRIVVADKALDKVEGKVGVDAAVALEKTGLRAFLWELFIREHV